ADLAEAPLELEQHGLVEIGHEGLQWHAGQHARTPEGRFRHRDVAIELVAPRADLLEIDRALGRLRRLAERAALVGRTTLALLAELADMAGELAGHHLVHEA